MKHIVAGTVAIIALILMTPFADAQMTSNAEKMATHKRKFEMLSKRNAFLNTKYAHSAAAPAFHQEKLRNLRRASR